jgi:hypothetical protein
VVAVKRTALGTLLLLAAGGAGVGWPADLLLSELLGSFLPIGVPGLTAIALAAAALAIWGWSIRDRLPRLGKDSEGKPLALRAAQPLPPLVAARTLAIAMAASRVGSLAAGFYAGLAVAAATNWHLEVARAHLALALLSAGAAVALSAAGLWVERLCALPPTPPDAAAESA